MMSQRPWGENAIAGGFEDNLEAGFNPTPINQIDPNSILGWDRGMFQNGWLMIKRNIGAYIACNCFSMNHWIIRIHCGNPYQDDRCFREASLIHATLMRREAWYHIILCMLMWFDSLFLLNFWVHSQFLSNGISIALSRKKLREWDEGDTHHTLMRYSRFHHPNS